MSTVETIGSTGDYTTIQSWYDAHKGDITSDANAPYIGELLAENHAGADLTGSTTDATHYFHLRAVSGSEFEGDFDATYPLVNSEGSNSAPIFTEDDYTRLEHFCVGGYTSNDNVAKAIRIYQASNVLLDSVGVYDIIAITSFIGDFSCIYANNSPDVIIRNCAIGKIVSSDGFGVGKSTWGIHLFGNKASGLNAYVYNNVVHDIMQYAPFSPSYVGIRSHRYDKSYIANNIVGTLAGAGTPVGIEATDHLTSTDVRNNATTDTSGGTDSQDNITPADEFVDTTQATLDLRIKSGGQCEGEGINLISNSYANAPTEDVENTTRPSTGDWDIGLNVLASAPSSGSDSTDFQMSQGFSMGFD